MCRAYLAFSEMKKKYIKPITENVVLNVNDDILDEIPIGPDSQGSHASDAWAKRNPFSDDEDDMPDYPGGTSGSHPNWNSWDD